MGIDEWKWGSEPATSGDSGKCIDWIGLLAQLRRSLRTRFRVSEADAADLAQEVVVRLLRGSGRSLSRIDDVGALVRVLARNAWVDARRRSEHRPWQVGWENVEIVSATSVAGFVGVKDLLERLEERVTLSAQMRRFVTAWLTTRGGVRECSCALGISLRAAYLLSENLRRILQSRSDATDMPE